MMFRNVLAAVTLVGALSQIPTANAQVLLSGGLTYSQNFDTLGNAPVNTNPTWTDNTTLPGWYASRAYTAGTTGPFGPFAYTSYRIDAGTANAGLLYSYGVAGVNPVTERALGSIGSGTVRSNFFGVRIQNDTASPVDNVLVSYTGEQWRNGGPTTLALHALAVTYQVSATPFSSPLPLTSVGWTAVPALTFTSPITSATAAALDGNAPANSVAISSVLLSGVTLNPGEEIFIRWLDIDDASNDHGLAVDNFSISFSAVPEPATATLFGLGAIGLMFFRRNRP